MASKQRLIDANALDFSFPLTDDMNGMLKQIGIEMMKARVMEAPTVDAVPVVQCKDCKWYKIAEDLVPYCSHESGYCGEHMGGLFYCAMGERIVDG